MPSGLPIHGRSFLFGLVVLGALGAMLGRPPAPRDLRTVDLAVEHVLPLTLSIDLTTKSGASLLQLTSHSNESTYVSVPVEWNRTQVKQAPLASVAASGSALGFVRWHIPAGASVIFQGAITPDHIRILNPNKSPMGAEYRKVDLRTGTVEPKSLLISDTPGIL